MLERVAAHYVGIRTEAERKYRIIWEVAQKKNWDIGFDVLYYATSITEAEITEEIGQKEGELIRQYRPLLNTQIPKETDWRKWDVVPLDAPEILKQLLSE